MSTFSEHEAFLRRALHSAADSLEPGHDGLERIQSRLRHPHPMPIAWAEAAGTGLAMRARLGWEAARPVLDSALGRLVAAMRLAWERFGPSSGSRGSRTMGWLRPLTAMGVAVFVVAAGAYVAINAQQVIFPSSSNSHHSQNGAQGPNGGGLDHGSSGVNASGSGGLIAPGPSSSASCKKAPKRKTAGPTSSPLGTIQPLSPSPTPDTSDSTSPSPSPSSSPNPSSSSSTPASDPTTSASTDPATVGTSSSPPTSHPPKPKPTTSPCTSSKKPTTNRLQVPQGAQSSPAGPSTSAAPPSSSSPDAQPTTGVQDGPDGQVSPDVVSFSKLNGG